MAWLQASLGSFFTGLSKVFTALGSEKVLVAVMGFFYWCWDKKTGLYAGINVAMSLVLNPMIKNAACRRRPYFDCPGVECLVPVEPSAWRIPGMGEPGGLLSMGSHRVGHD